MALLENDTLYDDTFAEELFSRELERSAGQRLALQATDATHLPFLLELFRSTQIEAVQRAGGDPSVVASPQLVDLQFSLRNASYASAYPHGRDHIILRRPGPAPIGRLLIDWPRSATEPAVCVDVAVHPAARGVGQLLLGAWLATCDALGYAARLHVLPHNPARRLYTRLGFVETEPLAVPVPMWREARRRTV